MKFGYTILYVENVKETLAFYEKAFGFQQKFITPEEDYGELITGETTIAIASLGLGSANFVNGITPSSATTKPFGIELAFVSETIESDFKRALENGATLFEPLSQKPWGQQVGYVRDINGFLIEICTPIKNE